MRVIFESVEERLSFKILGDILSIPRALLDSNLLITFHLTFGDFIKFEQFCTSVGGGRRRYRASKVGLSPWCEVRGIFEQFQLQQK